jgi:hypothetical protein
VVLVLSGTLLATHAALAARGGPKSEPALTITFHDLVDDGIQSDGKGSYEGTVESDGTLVLKVSKNRSLFFDFTECAVDHIPGADGCITPFGRGGSGEISGVTLTVPGFAGEADTSSEAEALFEFVEGGAQWRVMTVVVVSRTSDGAGGVEYSVRTESDILAALSHFGARGIGPGYWTTTGEFVMPWGVDATTF